MCLARAVVGREQEAKEPGAIDPAQFCCISAFPTFTRGGHVWEGGRGDGGGQAAGSRPSVAASPVKPLVSRSRGGGNLMVS